MDVKRTSCTAWQLVMGLVKLRDLPADFMGGWTAEEYYDGEDDV